MRVLLFSLALVLASTSIRAEETPRVPVVNFKLLLPFLPAPLSGWDAKKPDGNTMKMAAMELTTVSQQFTKGDSRTEIHIMDYAVQPEVLKGLTSVWQFSNEGTDGYQKSVSLDGGFSGFETWQEANKETNLFAMVANRYWVHVEVRGEKPETARAWMQKIDLKALSGVK